MARPRLKLLLVLFVLVVHSALVLCADDYYKILGLRKETRPSDRDVKTAYRRLSKKYHPDKHAGDDKAKDKFVQISEGAGCSKSPGRFGPKLSHVRLSQRTKSSLTRRSATSTIDMAMCEPNHHLG